MFLSGPSGSHKRAALCKTPWAELNMQAQCPHMCGKALGGRTEQAVEEEGRPWLGPTFPYLLSQTQSSAEPESSKSKPGLPGHRGSFCVKVRGENTFHLTVCELD